ncbi:MAG: glutamine amidotransferase [Planctomycetota bacterium]
MIAVLASLQDPAPAAGGAAPSGVYTEETFRFLALPELWIVGLVLLPAVVAFAWWCYGGLARLERPYRIALSLLRGLAVAACLLALFQPAYEQVRYSTVRTQIHVLVDDSASMSRRDTYPDQAQHAAMAKAAGETDIGARTRAELVGKVLAKPGGLIEQLEKNHDVRLFRFVRKPHPIGSFDELSARGARSPIGDALDLHLGASGATNLDAVILVSDGRNNTGLSPVEVAAKYRSNDLPIYAVGVGDPSPPRNIRLTGPPGPREALRLEEVAFDVTVAAEGLDGRAVTVTMFGERAGGAKQPLETAATTLLGDGEPQKVRLYHAFDEAGDWTLRFEVTALPEETTADDNVDTRFLRVSDERVRVLYVDSKPRWEYRYLKNALLRVDESIEAQVYLCDASRDFVQEHSPQLEPLREIPRTKEELFAYHVILLGDILPEQLAPTEDRRQQWLELLTRFVEHGGGLGVLWGEQAMPDRYRGTPLEDLLPVVLEEPDRVSEAEWTDFVPELENPAVPHDIVLLMREPERNEQLWRTGLPPLVSYYPVQQAKAGSTVLLRHPRDQNRFGKRPILTLGEVPRGRTMFLATDETWRWRYIYGEKYQDVFWRNVVRHLAGGRLRRRDDRVELRLDKVIVDTGDQVRVQLRLLDAELAPRRANEQAVFFRRADGQPERRTLQATAPGENGEFEGRFTLQDPGVVSVLVFENDNPDGQMLAREDVLVKIPDVELARSSQDRDTLEQVAAASKDGFYTFLGDTQRLIDAFKDRRPYETEVDRTTRPLWDTWWTFVIVLLLLTAEWILRKRVRLV